jgi:hypothetical protein
MAGGPFGLVSAIPVTANKVFDNTHVGAGSGMKYINGLGVMASVDGDAVWALVFQRFPASLPSGTCKLCLSAFANATSGAAKVNAKWASAAVGDDWSSLTLNAEGTSTLTWAAGNNDDEMQLKITLDADTPVAGERVIMNLTFETTSWTLAQVSTWLAEILFE